MKGWIWIVLGSLGVAGWVAWENRYKWGLMKKEEKDDASKRFAVTLPAKSEGTVVRICKDKGKETGYVTEDKPCKEGDKEIWINEL